VFEEGRCNYSGPNVFQLMVIHRVTIFEVRRPILSSEVGVILPTEDLDYLQSHIDCYFDWSGIMSSVRGCKGIAGMLSCTNKEAYSRCKFMMN
jgi:hypothetical protein